MASGVASISVVVNGQTYNLVKSTSDPDVWTTSAVAPSLSSGVNNSGKGTSIGGSGGYYLCKVTVTDLAGNVTTVTGNATGNVLEKALALAVKETTKPMVTLSSPSNGAYVTTSVPTFVWTVADSGSGVKSSTINIDGTGAVAGTTTDTGFASRSYTYTPTSALADGVHKIVLSGTDYDGNTTTLAETNFRIDTVPPELNISSMGAAQHATGYTGDNYLTNKNSITLSGTCSDANGVTLMIKDSTMNKTYKGSEILVSGKNWSCTVSCANNTRHVFTITATDGYGRATTLTRNVTCDTVAPVISSIQLTPNPVNVGATWNISVTVSDP